MKSVKNKPYPHVSFIIPTLNAQQYLLRCLKSIQMQKYPKKNIEILLIDAGSTDKTITIAKKFHCRIIKNPYINQEPGKNIGLKHSRGKLCFFLDADNALSNQLWLKKMVLPYQQNHYIRGLLPQTIPPKNSNGINRYLGYLFTDPFTWFMYGNAANPMDYEKIYTPIKKTESYTMYKFSPLSHPLFGLAQGVGTLQTFKKTGMALYDDILAGIKIIEQGGYIAHVPKAGVYHYHVSGFHNFLHKYQWRIRNNFQQRYKGFGLVNRTKYMNNERRKRQYLFILYSFSLLLPFFDAIKLSLKHKSLVMFWHIPACIGLTTLIIWEFIKYKVGILSNLSPIYGK